MIKKYRKTTIRTLLLTGLIIAALAGLGVFLAASAAEGDTGALQGGIERKNLMTKPGVTYDGSYRSELTDLEKQIYDVIYDRLIVKRSYEDFDNTIFSD